MCNAGLIVHRLCSSRWRQFEHKCHNNAVYFRHRVAQTTVAQRESHIEHQAAVAFWIGHLAASAIVQGRAEAQRRDIIAPTPKPIAAHAAAMATCAQGENGIEAGGARIGLKRAGSVTVSVQSKLRTAGT